MGLLSGAVWGVVMMEEGGRGQSLESWWTSGNIVTVEFTEKSVAGNGGAEGNNGG